MKIAVFDVDGVLADFEGRLNEVLQNKFGVEARCHRSLYRLEDRYQGFVLQTALGLVSDPNFYYGLDSDWAAMSFVDDLSYMDFKIMYLSSRPVAAEAFTSRWLKKYLDVNGIVRCGVADKAGFLKTRSIANDWDIAFVVDDNPDQIASLKAKGFRALCWEQPWNEGVFPRLYTRSDGVVMIWEDESVEARPFFEEQ